MQLERPDNAFHLLLAFVPAVYTSESGSPLEYGFAASCVTTTDAATSEPTVGHRGVGCGAARPVVGHAI